MARSKRRHRSAYTNILPVLLLGAVVALGVFVQLSAPSAERIYTYLVFGTVTIILASLGLFFAVFYTWRLRQRKIKALQMIDIDGMSGREFEEYLASLLKSRGFINVSLTQVSGDFGADLIATKNGVKYAVQAKRYVGQVGVDALYQCFGGQKYYGCDESMVITNSTFTEAAQELARKSNAILVDGEKLAQWIVEFQQQ